MENVDILQTIFTKLTDDVSALVRACSVNTEMRQVCAGRPYWSIIFKDNELEMPLFNYTTLKGWIGEFEKKIRIKLYINRAIYVLRHSDEIVIETGLGEYLHPHAIRLYNKSLFWFDILNVEEINPEISSILDNATFKFIDDTPSRLIDDDNDPILLPDSFIDVEYIDNYTYKISIGEHTIYWFNIISTYQISEKSLRQVLYRLLLQANIPYVMVGGDIVKLN